MFTPEELKNLGIFLNRVELKGSEALSLALLQGKVRELSEPKPVEEVVSKNTPPKK